MLRDLQETLRQSLLTGDDGALAAAVIGDGIPAGRRLAIYRNNIFGSLIGVLQAAYPAVCRRMGEAPFRAAARDYIRAHPPARPQLLTYGERFAGFLAAYGPARDLAYLPDLARLEWARNEAFFAADAEPLAAADLRSVSPERYPALRFTLHPSVRLVASRFPIQRLWEASRAAEGLVEPIDPGAGGEHVLILCPDLDVSSVAIAAAGFTMLEAMRDGATLEQAAVRAAEREPGFDLQQALAAHLTRGTFGGFALDPYGAAHWDGDGRPVLRILRLRAEASRADPVPGGLGRAAQ